MSPNKTSKGINHPLYITVVIFFIELSSPVYIFSQYSIRFPSRCQHQTEVPRTWQQFERACGGRATKNVDPRGLSTQIKCSDDQLHDTEVTV